MHQLYIVRCGTIIVSALYRVKFQYFCCDRSSVIISVTWTSLSTAHEQQSRTGPGMKRISVRVETNSCFYTNDWIACETGLQISKTLKSLCHLSANVPNNVMRGLFQLHWNMFLHPPKGFILHTSWHTGGGVAVKIALKAIIGLRLKTELQNTAYINCIKISTNSPVCNSFILYQFNAHILRWKIPVIYKLFTVSYSVILLRTVDRKAYTDIYIYIYILLI